MRHVDWQRLFDHLNVRWTLHGARTGNISINCPFCGDDPSEHLGINLTTGTYNCWRDSRHHGGDAVYVLRQLGLNRADVAHLLTVYALDKTETTPPVKQADDLPFLHPATGIYRDYLYSRGFENPEEAVTLGRLKAADWRLMFPLTSSSTEIEGWTGRGLYKDMKPKYKVYCKTANRCLFGDYFGKDLLILVEGPMDALKINCAKIPNVGAASITGINLSWQRTTLLAEIRPKHVLICLDSECSRSASHKMAETLSQITSARPIFLPDGYKDAAEMPSKEIREWLKGEIHASPPSMLHT